MARRRRRLGVPRQEPVEGQDPRDGQWQPAPGRRLRECGRGFDPRGGRERRGGSGAGAGGAAAEVQHAQHAGDGARGERALGDPPSRCERGAGFRMGIQSRPLPASLPAPPPLRGGRHDPPRRERQRRERRQVAAALVPVFPIVSSRRFGSRSVGRVRTARLPLPLVRVVPGVVFVIVVVVRVRRADAGGVGIERVERGDERALQRLRQPVRVERFDQAHERPLRVREQTRERGLVREVFLRRRVS